MIGTDKAAREWLADYAVDVPDAADRLAAFERLLRMENERQNLVSKSSLDELWLRHFADSAQLLSFVSRETPSWLDLGSGAGFPGVIAAIVRPSSQITLVESRRARIDWLTRLKKSLVLDNVFVAGSRLELLESFAVDVISARAFAPLDKLIEKAARFSTSQTHWLLPKGQSAQQELNELRGWRHTFHVEQSITAPRAGIIVGKLAGRKDKTS